MKPAPYPADTRAKGWRFELDHEQIRQSDTWALAPAELRPWLLMLWMVAWEQTPCGSMPNDDALIAARIGMQPKAFAKARDVLLRGWWLADDGRLYHDTIAARALSMLAKKEKDRARKAGWRAKTNDGRPQDDKPVPQESRVTDDIVSRVTDGGQARDSDRKDDTKHQAPSTRKRNTPPTPKGVDDPPGFDEFWAEYPRHDARRKAVEAFGRLAPDAELLREMLAAVRRQRSTPQWAKDGGQFVPMPATWLNGRRWEDGGFEARPDECPRWAAQAGFVSRWDAENEGCTERNASQFSEGRRVVAA